MSKKNKTQIPVESKSNNHENCYNEKDYKPWCKDCVPRCITEGWTSENNKIDEFVKDTICDAGLRYTDDEIYYPKFLEWVPYDRFKNIKQIGEGGFAKVYSATWIDGQAKYKRQDDGSWKKLDAEPLKVALKKLNESQNMSDECLNELKTHWKLNKYFSYLLTFYGMTKDPDTKEFIMITQFAEKGNLRSFLSTHFNKTLWKDKLNLLFKLISDLEHLHNLGYFHKDFHSGNILQIDDWSYISDFGLSGSSNEPKSDIKICGVLPYIAPEVLDRIPYTVSSDIYSFGVIMAELSSGKPPFHERKHDYDLSLEICNGLRPKFGKGTPKIYEKLAKKCMDARSCQRPTAKGLWKILNFWHECTEYNNYQDCKGKDIKEFFEEFEFGFKGKDIKNTLKDIKDLFEEFDHKGKEIKAMFEEADKEIPNISTSYEKNPDAIYSSRILIFIKPNDDENDDKDSKIHNLDINVTSCEKNPDVTYTSKISTSKPINSNIIKSNDDKFNNEASQITDDINKIFNISSSYEKIPDATCTSKISTPKPIFSNIIKSNDDKFNKEASSQIADDINKILNISSLYEKIPDATCTSKISTLSNLPKPISSNIIESNDDENNDEVIDSPDSEITNLDIADYNLP